MNKVIVAFIVGGLVGAVTTRAYFRKLYNDISDEEIASIKEKYCVKREESANTGDNAEEKAENPVEKTKKTEKPVEERMKRFRNMHVYREIMRQKGYTNYNDPGDAGIEEDFDDPYTIPPESFGQKYGNDNCITLTFYQDGILEDESGELVNDIDRKIGRENLSTFGEYEDDTVFVRNDVLKMDYEIQKVDEKYYRASAID